MEEGSLSQALRVRGGGSGPCPGGGEGSVVGDLFRATEGVGRELSWCGGLSAKEIFMLIGWL